MSTEISCHFSHLLLFQIIGYNSLWKIHCFTFFPYKSIRDQIWPCRKIGQGQLRVIIWTNLVVLEHPMLHTNFQGHRPFGSRDEDFLRFLPHMGVSAILVMWPGPFEQTFVPPSHGGPIWNLTLTDQAVSEVHLWYIWSHEVHCPCLALLLHTTLKVLPFRAQPRRQFGRKSHPNLVHFFLFWTEGEVKMCRTYREIHNLDKNFSLSAAKLLPVWELYAEPLRASYYHDIPDKLLLKVKEIQSKQTKNSNDPKFSDRYAWVNSADPDQTAPRGAVWSRSPLFAIPFASFGLITLW